MQTQFQWVIDEKDIIITVSQAINDHNKNINANNLSPEGLSGFTISALWESELNLTCAFVANSMIGCWNCINKCTLMHSLMHSIKTNVDIAWWKNHQWQVHHHCQSSTQWEQKHQCQQCFLRGCQWFHNFCSVGKWTLKLHQQVHIDAFIGAPNKATTFHIFKNDKTKLVWLSNICANAISLPWSLMNAQTLALTWCNRKDVLGNKHQNLNHWSRRQSGNCHCLMRHCSFTPEARVKSSAPALVDKEESVLHSKVEKGNPLNQSTTPQNFKWAKIEAHEVSSLEAQPLPGHANYCAAHQCSLSDILLWLPRLIASCNHYCHLTSFKCFCGQLALLQTESQFFELIRFEI